MARIERLGDNVAKALSEKITKEALLLSEEKFSKVFYTSPDAITLNKLSDGLYININDGYTDILGYTIEDVKGKSQ